MPCRLSMDKSCYSVSEGVDIVLKKQFINELLMPKKALPSLIGLSVLWMVENFERSLFSTSISLVTF